LPSHLWRPLHHLCHAPAPTPIYALSLHDALPISQEAVTAWRAVTQANPHDAGAFASLGLDLARLGKYAEAVHAKLAKAPASWGLDRKSTRLNSSHVKISYAVFCLKKKKEAQNTTQ